MRKGGFGVYKSENEGRERQPNINIVFVNIESKQASNQASKQAIKRAREMVSADQIRGKAEKVASVDQRKVRKLVKKVRV